MNDVVAGDVVNEVVAGAAVDEVVTATAVDFVVAAVAPDRVVVGVAGFQLVGELGAADHHRVAEEVVVAEELDGSVVEDGDQRRAGSRRYGPRLPGRW